MLALTNRSTTNEAIFQTSSTECLYGVHEYLEDLKLSTLISSAANQPCTYYPC